MMKTFNKDMLISWLGKNPYVVLVFAIGAVFLILPSSSSDVEAVETVEREVAAPIFSLEDEETRLAEILESISGVGEVRVLLSLSSTATRKLATSAGEAIIISEGSGHEVVVDNSYDYPTYLGAVVVCEGAGDAQVRLDLVKAVSAYSGLGSSKIIILEMA